MIDIFSSSTLEEYYVPILQILLTRLQNSRTETFALRFVRFYHFVAAKGDKGLGTDFFINVTEQVQSGYVNSTIQIFWLLYGTDEVNEGFSFNSTLASSYQIHRSSCALWIGKPQLSLLQGL